MKFEERLQELMQSGSVTQSALAKATGISQAALSNYLSGRIPKSDELYRLAQHFGVSMEGLFMPDEPVSNRTMAMREGEDTQADLELWRKRAKAAEKELAMIKAALRAFANSSEPSEVQQMVKRAGDVYDAEHSANPSRGR